MEEKIETKPSTIKRIGGYLHRVIPIADKSGKVPSDALKPLMVEFKTRDVFQVVVGASILAIKRIIIVAFPASMSATVSDTIQ
jgi:hypothetical protein